MSILDQVIQANQKFVYRYADVANKEYDCSVSKMPNRHVALFTCMDTRLVEFLEPAMGIKRGEAKVIKNAGNCITGPFESTTRSLLLAIFELDIKEIMVVGHLDCGVANANSKELIKKMLSRGISSEAIKMVELQLAQWLDQIHNPIDNVIKVVSQLRNNPLIPKDVPIHGLIFDPNTGAIEIIRDGYFAK